MQKLNTVKSLIIVFICSTIISIGHTNIGTSNKVVECYKDLQKKTLDLPFMTNEMLALMCGRLSIKKINSEAVSIASSCLHSIAKYEPPKQSFFDYAILCSGLDDKDAINIRFACVVDAYKLIKERWSERDKYILCGNVKTESDHKKAISCYFETKSKLGIFDDPQVYAILCSGGNR